MGILTVLISMGWVPSLLLADSGRESMGKILYGDGIHDDYPVIQELLDSGACEVVLPAPKKHYLISQTLILSSCCRLVLPRFAVIRLAAGANCHMVRSHTKANRQNRLPEDSTAIYQGLFYHVDAYDPDEITENIEICGGIWDFQNMKQLSNPEQTGIFGSYGYTGDCMLFYGVHNLKLSDMTIKDPVHFGIMLDRVTDFTVENITFDYNLGNPTPINMDGIHCNGNCHRGVIRNLKGACYDDMIALNAQEGSQGAITDIEIDGLFAENCHSAVRLLTVSDQIERIHISNVFGTFYQYGIGLTKYYPGETTGSFEDISIDHIYISKAPRPERFPFPDCKALPLIYLASEIRAGQVKISDVYRRETCLPVETIYIGRNTEIRSLLLDHIISEDCNGEQVPLLYNRGSVDLLEMNHINERAKICREN